MLTHLQNKIKALQAFSFENELVKIVTDHKENIANLQAAQLAQGIDSKGDRITIKRYGDVHEGYAPFTIYKKQTEGVGLGAITDRITWFMSGRLYKSLREEVTATKFTLKSDALNDFKLKKLIAKSGAKAVGLNLDSRRDFVQEITRPKILEAYKQKVTDVS